MESSPSSKMYKWVSERLSDCLEFPVPENLVTYILSFENSDELEEYLKTLLNVANPKHRSFVSEILQKKKPPAPQASTASSTLTSDGAGKSKKKYKQVLSLSQNAPPIDKTDKSNDIPAPTAPSAVGKKKTKFINLYSQEGQNREIVLLKGRHRCDCQASKHSLINNCTQCGRIICQQEGSGPCLFCGNLVCTPEEQQVLNASTKKSNSLYNKLMEQKRPVGWEEALAQRNRLLEYDRTSERRTRVTDDDSDYFNSGSVWLSKSERSKLEKYQQSVREKKHASRLHKTFTLDFAGRELIEEPDFGSEVDENILREITQHSNNTDNRNDNQTVYAPNDGDIHPGYVGPPPQFDDSIKSRFEGTFNNHSKFEAIQRVQDAQLQEMGDKGVCLSMHQPWASLLVAGIKIHEGRSWYTAHRGRLWIASTVQPPDNETVRSVENMYTGIYPDKKIIFPKHYPTGCLLGCVSVDECLGEEEYHEIYPDGESGSPFVFICSNPQELALKFPVKGKHKIYPLDQKIHQAAIKSLHKMLKIETN